MERYYLSTFEESLPPADIGKKRLTETVRRFYVGFLHDILQAGVAIQLHSLAQLRQSAAV